MGAVAALDLYLASQSPRRRDLLARAGLRFETCAPGAEYLGDAHEHDSERGEPRQLAVERARRKAAGARVADAAVPVLAVDTVVDLDGVELGKAVDRDAAARLLARLAGRVHRVHTAHCLRRGEVQLERVCTSLVACRAPGADELRRYIDSEQWRGKAGAYGIQDDAQGFLTLQEGAFDTVVGLHVDAVRDLLRACGGAP